jgi:hypothetical protein
MLFISTSGIGLEFCTAAIESGRGLGFVYTISLFTFVSGIVLDLISLYLYVNASFPNRNNN